MLLPHVWLQLLFIKDSTSPLVINFPSHVLENNICHNLSYWPPSSIHAITWLSLNHKLNANKLETYQFLEHPTFGLVLPLLLKLNLCLWQLLFENLIYMSRVGLGMTLLAKVCALIAQRSSLVCLAKYFYPWLHSSIYREGNWHVSGEPWATCERLEITRAIILFYLRIHSIKFE